MVIQQKGRTALCRGYTCTLNQSMVVTQKTPYVFRKWHHLNVCFNHHQARLAQVQLHKKMNEQTLQVGLYTSTQTKNECT